jgi:hypothetical protein
VDGVPTRPLFLRELLLAVLPVGQFVADLIHHRLRSTREVAGSTASLAANVAAASGGGCAVAAH